jgi:hypothetical protein
MKAEDIKKAIDYKKAYLNLVHFALDKGCSITVWYDGEEELLKSKDYKAIKDTIENMDEAEISIYGHYDKQVGWAYIIPYNEDEATVADWTTTSLLNEWDKQFQKLTEELEVVQL